MDRIRAIYESVLKFLHDTRAELRRVVWPTRRETTVYTAIVLGAVIVFGAVIWGIDGLFSLGLNAVIR